MIRVCCALLLVSVVKANHTMVESLQFGRNSFPVVFLDLQAANHSGTKCVTVNGKPLCTTIDFCSLDNYQCSSISPQGHQCTLSGPGCSCTATWGGGPTDDESPTECECYVSPDGPYWVHADVRCPPRAPKDTIYYANFLLGSADTDCSDPWDGLYSGVQDDNSDTKIDNALTGTNDEKICRKGRSFIGMTEVYWDCPAEETDPENRATTNSQTAFRPDEQCTCHAIHHYQDCSSCQPCAAHEPGDFRVSCPGFFTDCFQTFSVWDHETTRDTPSSGWKGLSAKAALMLVAISWALSSLVSH